MRGWLTSPRAQDFASTWLKAGVTFAVAVTSVLFKTHWILPWLLVPCALLAFAIAVVEFRRGKTLSNLTKQLEQAQGQNNIVGDNIKNLFDGVLYNLSKKLEFRESDPSRISLYIHDGGGRFIPFGRYSPNPELQKPGRTSYPDSQGCIARGWQDGWCFDADFPADLAGHQAKCEASYGIPAEVHRSLKMHSRAYAVKRINDAYGAPLAVLVVESTDDARFDADRLQESLAGTLEDYSQMIRILRPHIPKPSDASEKGL